jgi:Na+/H+ antiporter NhaA
VAIFVAGLAFGAGQQYTESRIAILMASTCAAVLGSMLLAFTPRASARAAESMEEETSAVRA